MAARLFIFGVSDYSSLVAHYFRQQKQATLGGFVVDDEFLDGKVFSGLSVTPYSVYSQNSANQQSNIFSAIGYRSMRTRKSIFQRIHDANFTMVSFVHESAYVDPSASLGVNCIVMPGAVIERNVKIGNNVTVWSNATVCHDSVIGPHCFLASNCVIGGNCVLGSSSFFGFSSTVIQNTVVEPETLLGASSLMRNCGAPYGKYLGVPARRISEHKESGICIS